LIPFPDVNFEFQEYNDCQTDFDILSSTNNIQNLSVAEIKYYNYTVADIANNIVYQCASFCAKTNYMLVNIV